MEQKEKSAPVEQGSEVAEKKRQFINFTVTPEEKLQITKEAVSVCKISVSEYCRTKIFMPKPEINPEIVEEAFPNEEKEIYENTIKEIKEENTKLKDEVIKLKVFNSTPGQEEKKEIIEEKDQVSESDIIIKLSAEERTIINMAVGFESDRAFGKTYKDINHFLMSEILKLIKANGRSYGREYFQEGTPEYITSEKLIERLNSGGADQEE